MAYTSADLNRLQAAVADPARKVRFDDGREVEYRTMQELRDAIAVVTADLARQSGTGQTMLRKSTFRRS